MYRSNRRLLLLGSLALWALGGCGADDEPICDPSEPTCQLGYRSLLDMNLARERIGSPEALMISSYDRAGGNLDLGLIAPGNSVLYVDDSDRNVIFDEQGPGMLTRIWLTDLSVNDALGSGAASLSTLKGDIWFQFDDEPTARIRAPIGDFFAGKLSPYVEPFVGDPNTSCGGYISYVPMPFAERLVISTSNLVNYVQVGAYRVGGPVESFAPDAVSADLIDSARTQWQQTDPPDVPDDALHEQRSMQIDESGEASITIEDGPGVLLAASFELTPEPSFRPQLWLRMEIDGQQTVNVPWGDFFLVPLKQVAASSRLLGRRDSGRYEIQLPMPYAKSLKLTIASDHPTAYAVEIDLLRHARPIDGLLRLHAEYREQILEATDPDFRLVDIDGFGHLVATAMTMCCREDKSRCAYLGGDSYGHLEGDEKITIDDADFPQLHGTGAEDYFNSGFYYLNGQAYQRPTHGMPYQHDGGQTPNGSLPGNAFDCTTQYRLHLSDPIPFRESLVFDLEHGPESNYATWFSSVVFYYRR